MCEKTLADLAYEALVKLGGKTSLKKIYDYILKLKPNSIPDSIRCSIYRDNKGENNSSRFKRVGKGLYIAVNDELNVTSLIVYGSGRKMECIEDNSIDSIITDHPWLNEKAHESGNQASFVAGYKDTCFKYTLDDFKSKYRVLKKGAFLVEVVPTETATNYEYLYQIKQMAVKAGFQYYAKVPWVKKGMKANNGRTVKDREDILFFTKGKPRRLAPQGKPYFTAKMLPSQFEVAPVSPSKKIHKAEKPVPLFEKILEYITFPGDWIVDQFGGSGNISKAANNKGRNSIVFEFLKENVEKIKNNLKAFITVFEDEPEDKKESLDLKPFQLSFI